MAGVYLAYPFCAQKCTFCNFASGVFPRETEARYVHMLAAEIERHQWTWRPETLYLGGGTPSAIHLDDFRRILSLVPGRPWREATIEAAPGSITTERACAWVEAGINRVSLGVQSFVRAELARTGRRHTAESVANDVRLLREAGIAAINIDLIAGLPAQTEATWRESLAWIARLAPEHVSVYMLEVDEDSRLGREILTGGARYGASGVPSGDLMADLYLLAVDTLAALGIPRYEISNFARPGCESRHNLKYWKLEPYAGFGAGAHSFDGRVRRENPEDLTAYLSGQPAEETPAHPGEERFFVGLRLTEGIRPAPDEWLRFREPIEQHLRDGLLEKHNGILRLTSRGVLLSNEVFQEFIQ
ncbi:MAG TPA: coproporphyrinogen-III oxidase family protein [Bryobacteraceae bacterium]|nr:coproporphyrinogen-III oxidase family protein [Bryobacteraceae bacterium]